MSEGIILHSLHGKALGMGNEGHLIANTSPITSRCADATITVSAEGATTANTRDITIQLLDAKGNDIDYAEQVLVTMWLDADRAAYVTTGGSTGIDVGTDGALLDIVAKKLFLATSETDGDIDLEWLDTGTEVAFLSITLPTGRIIMSSALTNA